MSINTTPKFLSAGLIVISVCEFFKLFIVFCSVFVMLLFLCLRMRGTWSLIFCFVCSM